MIFHLPAALRAGLDLDSTYYRLTTACGRRGPIKIRESAAPDQDLFQDDENTAANWERHICPECLVRWDEAEGGGSLLVVWTLNGKTAWRAGGAVVFTQPPVCPKCRGRSGHLSVFAAVAR